MKKVFMLACESDLISTKEIDNSPTINSYAQLLVDVMDDRSIVTGDVDYIYKEKVYHRTDKAMIYRSLNRRSIAITQLDDILTYANPNDFGNITELRCLTNAEKQLLDELISYDQFELIVQSCLPQNTQLRKKTLSRTLNSESEIINLSPNPTSNVFTISSANILSDKAELSIYDTKGKLILQKQLNVSENYIFERIELAKYAKGLFFVHIKLNDQVIVKKVIVQ